ncbi:MAG: hypothetical protein IK093_00015 [Ruminiclostridium sp.]|nr:hypothetical protein [Ruminiclostridium sp.]
MLHRNDEDILNTICKNSRMAYESTGQVMSRCRDSRLTDYLARQRKHYAETYSAARKRLNEGNSRPEPVPPMQLVMAHIGIAAKTAFDRSTGHIAELMYDGTNMGIIDIARSVNRSSHAAPENIRLAESLLSDEEKYADGLRKFL